MRARDLMTSEIHSMVKVEADEDRARLITQVDEKEKKFSKETRLLVITSLLFPLPVKHSLQIIFCCVESNNQAWSLHITRCLEVHTEIIFICFNRTKVSDLFRNPSSQCHIRHDTVI